MADIQMRRARPREAAGRMVSLGNIASRRELSFQLPRPAGVALWPTTELFHPALLQPPAECCGPQLENAMRSCTQAKIGDISFEDVVSCSCRSPPTPSWRLTALADLRQSTCTSSVVKSAVMRPGTILGWRGVASSRFGDEVQSL